MQSRCCSTANPESTIAIALALALAIALYVIWHSSASTSTSPGITQQNFSGTSANTGSSTGNPATSSGDIQVYIVGAVKHPGVYTLPAGARVYQLLQAAGGPLPDANLVVSLVSKCTEYTWTRSFTPPLSIEPSQRSFHIPGG